MKAGKNKRLANVKTRTETGLEYILSCINLNTPFGKSQLKEIRPFFAGEEEPLTAELDKVDQMIGFARENPRLVEQIEELFMEVKDVSYTLDRSGKSVLSVVEIYEVKTLLLQMRKLSKLLEKSDSVPDEYRLEDTTELLDVLDPRGDRINTFYIYDEFSEKLGQLRQEKRLIEQDIRREQKAKRESIRKEYGIQLTPKFDIMVSRSSGDLEKVKAIADLELVDEDYMALTFQLKQSGAVFDYVKKMEELNLQIEEEEETIRARLSQEISEYARCLTGNCRRMGALDLALGKATYAIAHSCSRPEITKEHVIEIEEGRNLQVEDILSKKGKKYCPVSISLGDGVTCITGANMGGKTISLKLVGQVAILAQYGFFVPCRRARVGLSNYMHMLIGDSQSVERGLSSFGSEMEELKEILDNSRERSVILIDEIASGTNPVEGLALTRSLVDYLKEKPYITLITTHFETVTETEGVINMQVRGLADADFSKLNREIQYANRRERINVISKYMDYRLYRVQRQGQVPKDALNIAKMLGIGKEIIDGAQKYLK